MISKVIRFFKTDIWKIRLKNLPAPKAFALKWSPHYYFSLAKFCKRSVPEDSRRFDVLYDAERRTGIRGGLRNRQGVRT